MNKTPRHTSVNCGCIDVSIGSYDNQVLFLAPEWSDRAYLCLDKCIALEVIELWCKNIETTGCCCGHNTPNLYTLKGGPYIGVVSEDIPKMKELGYKVAYNPLHPERGDSFTPKIFMIPQELTQ